MSPPPVPQKERATWYDDPNIGNEEVLYRFCKTASQITRTADGRYVLSDQTFSASGGGVSTEMKSLIEADGHALADRLGSHVGLFAVQQISCGQVRSVTNKDQKGNPTANLKVAYTPIESHEPHGPNPFHADIFPAPSPSAKAALFRHSVPAIDVDQEKAEVAYCLKMGKPRPERA